MRPKVSVVLVTYNQAPFLRASVDSVIAQKFPSFELIIVNDCSPDDTRQVLAAYEGLPNVRIVHNETNKGLQRSTDDAIRSAQGDYVLWTSGDDVHLPGLLEAESDVLDRNPRVGFVYCRAHYLAADGEVTGLVTLPGKPWLDQDYVRDGLEEFEALLHSNHVATTGAVLFRRTLYEQVGGLDFNLPEASDWDLWLRLSLVSDAAHLAAPLFGWRRHAGTLSAAMHRSGQAHVDVLEVVRKAFSRVPSNASRIAKLEGKVLSDAYLRLAAHEYLAGTEERSESDRAAQSRRARSYLAKALRMHPQLVFESSNLKLGICVLLGPTWGPRAVRLTRRRSSLPPLRHPEA